MGAGVQSWSAAVQAKDSHTAAAAAPLWAAPSGGLGPTYDDMTLEGISKALNKPLKINEKALSWVTRKFEDLLKKGILKEPLMTEPRRKMAILPSDSEPLPNPAGTAPGVLLDIGKTKIFCLPGIPKELEAIFEGNIRGEILKEMRGLNFIESGFIVEGLGESFMAPIIEETMKKYAPYVYVKSHPKHGMPKVTVELNITSHGSEFDFLKSKNEDACNYLKDKFKGFGGKILPIDD